MRERDPRVEGFLRARAAAGASSETLRAYGSDLDELASFVERAGGDLDACDAELLRRWQARLGARALAPATVSRKLSAARSLFAHLAAGGASDPSAALLGPRRARRLPEAPTAGDCARLLDGRWPDGAEALRDRAALELLYGCGLRVSELCGLDVANCDLRAGRLRVVGKGDRERVVPIVGAAHEALAAWLARGRPELARAASGDALLLGPRGARLRPPAVRTLLAQRARAAGIPELTPHALRHAYATHLLEGGAGVREIQDLLGHASPETTQIYAHVAVPHLRRAHALSHPRG